MECVDGNWIMCGVEDDDPNCLHNVDECYKYIKEVGFLPLFKNDIPGYSVEERTVPDFWWSEYSDKDPWAWRQVLAKYDDIVYGKFFDKKAGFITKEWFPHFANYRRDGYDFDARWDDEKASIRQKKIMDVLNSGKETFSFEIKEQAGFGKGGEKNFEGTMTGLEMQTYLVVTDFKKKKNKQGKEYGWDIALYSKPEMKWGYDIVSSKYKEEPAKSFDTIFNHMRNIYPVASDKQIKKLLK